MRTASPAVGRGRGIVSVGAADGRSASASSVSRSKRLVRSSVGARGGEVREQRADARLRLGGRGRGGGFGAGRRVLRVEALGDRQLAGVDALARHGGLLALGREAEEVVELPDRAERVLGEVLQVDAEQQVRVGVQRAARDEVPVDGLGLLRALRVEALAGAAQDLADPVVARVRVGAGAGGGERAGQGEDGGRGGGAEGGCRGEGGGAVHSEVPLATR